jgi:DNA-binding GntR family transcriptional regulator
MAPEAPRHRIKRLSLPEALADSLRERILNGEFKEGDPLVQEAIAEEYEVSRMPVREALRQLEAQGLIELKTHKGAVVTSVPAEQVEELFDLRALLECQILERAIPLISDAELDQSEAILVRLEDAYRRRDIAAWGRLNWDFHRSLYQPAGRVQTLAIIDGINLQTDRYIRLQLLLSDSVANAEQDHRELLRLCRERQTDAAVQFLRRHILDAALPLPHRGRGKVPTHWER